MAFSSGCNSEKKQNGYSLARYYYSQDGVYNMELYMFNNYEAKKSLKENLAKINLIQCFVFPITKNNNNYKFIQKLPRIKEQKSLKAILCEVDFEVKDENGLQHHFSRSEHVKFDSFTIQCDYYFLSFANIDFHKFKLIEDIVLK